MTPSYIRWVVGKVAATRWSSADYSSKQNNGKKGSLSPPFQLLQGNMSYICVGGEADLRP